MYRKPNNKGNRVIMFMSYVTVVIMIFMYAGKSYASIEPYSAVKQYVIEPHTGINYEVLEAAGDEGITKVPRFVPVLAKEEIDLMIYFYAACAFYLGLRIKRRYT